MPEDKNINIYVSSFYVPKVAQKMLVKEITRIFENALVTK
jgi:hypothetical protein